VRLLAACVGQFWQIFRGLYRSIFNHCDVLASKAMEFGEITQNKYTVQGYSRSPMSVPMEARRLCDFLLVINTNRHHISYRFEVIADYCSSFLATLRFWAPIPLRVLWTTYTVHLRVIRRLVVDYLFALIELFFVMCYNWCATREYWLKMDVMNVSFGPLWRIAGDQISSVQWLLEWPEW